MLNVQKETFLSRNKNILVGLIGGILIFFIVILLFIYYSSPTEVPKTSNIQEKTFRIIPQVGSNTDKFNYNLGVDLNIPKTTENKKIYFYTTSPEVINIENILKTPITIKLIEDNKGKISNDENSFQINYTLPQETSVFGFNEEKVNLEKLLKYLNEININLKFGNIYYETEYFIETPEESTPSNKAEGDIMVISLTNGVNNNRIILKDNNFPMSVSFDKSNRIKEIKFNSKEIVVLNLEEQVYTFSEDIINLLNNTTYINKYGLFDYYIVNPIDVRTLDKTSLVYLSAEDNYLIPYIKYFNSENNSNVLVPLISPSNISY